MMCRLWTRTARAVAAVIERGNTPNAVTSQASAILFHTHSDTTILAHHHRYSHCSLPSIKTYRTSKPRVTSRYIKMPPKRRTSGPRTTSAQRAQSTLSFGKGQQNRITKPSAAQQAKKSKKDAALFDIKPAVAEPDLEETTTADSAIAQQVEEEQSTAAADPLADGHPVSKTEDVLGGRAQESTAGATGGKTGAGWIDNEEAEARKVKDSQIKAYWRRKEQERKAPRVHQENLDVGEKVLREWDMSGQYGPCIGIARLKRWKRAKTLGLEPPIEVLAVLLKGTDGHNAKMQRAHVDELMSSRFIET